MSNGSPGEEYKELNNNLRFYGNMRFAQLTLFFAVTAALLTAVFTLAPPLAEPTRTILKVGGLIVTFLFWVMEYRSTGYGMHFKKRIDELEKLLGYRQWQGRPMGTEVVFSATNAVCLLYLFPGLFWLTTLVWRSNF